MKYINNNRNKLNKVDIRMDKMSIIVPCFNEKEALPLFYNKITQVFDQMSQESVTAGLSYELIIVDDGSMDGTLDVAKELATNLFHAILARRQPCMQACSMRWGNMWQ